MITIGIDEVGRGCWAGPIVAGAVLLTDSIEGLADSKQLSKKQREALNNRIKASNAQIGLGWVDVKTLDKIGLTEAVRLAMRRALAGITGAYDEIIIDGHYNFLSDIKGTKAIIKADDSIPCVSAASIVAKVARDQYMSGLGDTYGFATHVGYGTALHVAMLKKYGVSELHRTSFKPIAAILNA